MKKATAIVAVVLASVLYSGAAFAGVGGNAIAPAHTTLLVTVIKSISKYPSPNKKSSGIIPATWENAPSVLPVINEQKSGWYQVRIPTKPNSSTTWIHPSTSSVAFSFTPYSIVINTKTMHLNLFKLGKADGSFPVGVGTTTNPTPQGSFFVAYIAQPPSSGYGPFVLVTSAHSNTITDWEGTGDGNVAIHGPLGADSQIGNTGARVSHGCVRMHVSDQEKLSQVPSGTLVTIQS